MYIVGHIGKDRHRKVFLMQSFKNKLSSGKNSPEKLTRKMLYKDYRYMLKDPQSEHRAAAVLAHLGVMVFKLLIWACVIASIPAAFYYIITSPANETLLQINGLLGDLLLVPSVVISAGTLFFFLLQAIHAVLYKETPALKDEFLPALTVIVPAYNEGKYVETTLESILESDYPAEKLEIIAVNDGSMDDTWSWIEHAVARFPGRIKGIDIKQNGGKKHALCAGIEVAEGEVIVTVDSDSRVAKDALRKIASPFVVDPAVGAIAGNIRVNNLKEGSIPKMLDVAFAFGFEFMRTAQSMVHSVLCTPGALSAYRLAALRPLLEEWKKQTFMGKPASIGEDRAITSLLIKNNWHVDFQIDAIAFTKMPVTYKGLCKMLIRWCRSDVRENLGMILYAFHPARWKKPSWDLLMLEINLLFSTVSMILPLFFLPMLFFAFVTAPILTAIYTLSGSILWSMMPAVIYAVRYSARESVWAFVYGLYAIPFISWISVYSVFTVGNSDWMTRALPRKKSGKKVLVLPFRLSPWQRFIFRVRLLFSAIAALLLLWK